MDSDLKKQLDALKIDREDRPRGPGRAVWIALAGVLAVAAVAAGWWALRSDAVPVGTALAETGARAPGGGTAVLNASGYVTARRQATVSSKFTGKVVEVLVEEGLQVEKDQVLARLDASQIRQALDLAESRLAAERGSTVEIEAQLREARLRETRTRRLVEGGISTDSEGDAIEAEVDVLEARLSAQGHRVRAAEHEVRIARQNLDDTVIRAPFAGIAVSKNAQPGEIISPMSAGGGFTRTGISTIVDMTSLEIEVDVNEAYIQRVKQGQKVEATLDAYRDWQIPARVITTIPAADRQKATVTVRIAFVQLDPRILPDMGVKVAFLGSEAPGDAAPARVVRVPRSAVRGSSGEEFLLVVGGDRRLERRAIKLGPGGEDPAEIVAGIAPGERVVVDGPADLAAGDEVVERRSD